ncbi:3-oxoacyl-acyl-carrier-protein reductase [Spathaspora sp. JA1]|nr:3-oxoacyl-acyl-carrier-protein reductase [Spathaspora sp. JA1]
MFTGQHALITGGSRGIGLAIAKKLSDLGATITLVARSSDSTSILSQLSTSYDQQHRFHTKDLLKLVDEDASDLIPKDVTMLVNCAGVTTHSLLSHTSHKDIIDTINLNLLVPIILSKQVIKPMIKNRKLNPSILNISSVLSITDYKMAGTSVYASSKAGLLGLTTSLAYELKGRVRVNSLLPGLVKETDMGSQVKLTEDLPLVSLSCVVEEAVKILGGDMNGECVVLDKSDSYTLPSIK